MFTGLTEKCAVIAERDVTAAGGTLSLHFDDPFNDLQNGESIAVNGVCLTVEKFTEQTVSFHLLGETFTRSNLGTLPLGARVNIERAMMLSDRLGGHIVSGHIDNVAEVADWTPAGDDMELSVFIPDSLQPYIIEKGSIAIDGISLTVVAVNDKTFSVHLIPVTLRETAIAERKAGMPVNLEADIIGKYVEKQLLAYSRDKKSNVSMEMLRNAGWE